MGKTTEHSDIEIRIAEHQDREVLVSMFLKLLQFLEPFEHDMLPTRENAEFVVDVMLMPAAARGEPVLIAWKEGRPIGAIFWVIQDLPYQSRWKTAYGYGTFIEEGYRSKKIGTLIRKKGFEILKAKGVDRLVGMVLLKNKLSLENCDRTGAIPIARMDHFLVK